MGDDLHDNHQIPDVIEVVTGWRGWNVVSEALGTQGVLASPHLGNRWEEGHLSWSGECECDARGRAYIIDVTPQDLVEIDRQLEEGVPDDEIEMPRSFRVMANAFGGVANAMDKLADKLMQQAEELEGWCHCGINAFASIEALMERRYHQDPRVMAVGEVELWGRVRVFERGYRGEHGRAVRVWSLRSHDLVQIACEQAGIEYAGVFEHRSPSLPV